LLHFLDVYVCSTKTFLCLSNTVWWHQSNESPLSNPLQDKIPVLLSLDLFFGLKERIASNWTAELARLLVADFEVLMAACKQRLGKDQKV
jgi:hypothetical protein